MSLITLKTSESDLGTQAERALSQWIEPCLGCDLLSAGAVRALRVEGTHLHLALSLGFPADGYQQALSRALQALLLAHTQARTVTVEVDWTVTAAPVTAQAVPGVKHLIAVASGKGGVGKSTTATNLALALAADGARVGMLDADLYGPSQPRLLGLSGIPESRDGKLEPMLGHGLQCMSIGFLVDEETPVIWRGPMITQALTRLLQETHWQELDYLIVDLPPGTGDTHLTLAQKMPVSAALIVTTPQDLALLDARKGLRMFEKVNVPVLGIIENMSLHVCSQCGHEEHIFGSGGARRMAEQYGSELLGELPLDMRIRIGADDGLPIVTAEPQGALAQSYRNIARRAMARLSLRSHQTAAKLPQVVEA
ncbi:iron-sulfur cluster carrier protein ApbC [Pseudomonas sp. MTM4]|uniref:iron-sulfur cluster carrier protein ApbC n=1 Tax=unclassified Pseudomonas TaxID=196821 RepID=UPI0018D262B5|nr:MULTISPECIES: iron-sulfur cluster carrier protein ApbC [unclassified Pseudomonas]MBC8649861.1 iron-sulfur cluster carrier protein ApbC [Pseudomonas sp. MT4]QXY92205.1 iron-sulfur cluster carrier protein ApbC [Pseudomonas sp. MTM4]